MKTLKSHLERIGSKKDLQKAKRDLEEELLTEIRDLEEELLTEKRDLGDMRIERLTKKRGLEETRIELLTEKDVYESLFKSLSAKLPLPIFDTLYYIYAANMVSHLLGYQAPPFVEKLIFTGFSVGIFNLCFNSLFDHWAFSKNKINFLETFGADVKHHKEMPLEMRISEINELTEKVNDEYTPQEYERKYLAQVVNRKLTTFIAEKSGVHVHTSDRVRNFGISKLIFPFAKGAHNPLDGEVFIFENLGVFEPHVITHEFAHKKGYTKELEAQALAYLTLINSRDQELTQSAYCERLFNDMIVTADFDIDKCNEDIETSALRSELKQDFKKRTRKSGLYEKVMSFIIKPLYDLRMKITGQNGLKDYSLGFTNFLYTIEDTTGEKIRK